MKIWHYHPASGQLMGEGLADPDPLTPGAWLIPAHATTQQPPALAVGQMAVWDAVGWVINAIPAPPPQPPAPTLTPAQQIEALEREHQLARPVRDFMLGSMELAAVEQGAAAGLTAEQSIQMLRARNPGYRRVKELDEQITALRALL